LLILAFTATLTLARSTVTRLREPLFGHLTALVTA